MKKILMAGLIFFAICCSACGVATCNDKISVSGIEFDENYVEIYVGDEYCLDYVIYPENADNKNVSFYSSDKTIVTVQNDGMVYAVAQGAATVTVTTEDGSYSDICNITVKTKEEEGTGQEQGSDTDSPSEVEIYTVTFIADGVTVAVCEFSENSLSVDIPEAPEKSGYTAQWESFTISLQNIVVYAVYTPIEYVASFIDYNGEVIFTTTYTVESTSIPEPEVPEREYYIGSWEDYSLTAGGLTIYAVYIPVEYKAVFIANGIVVSTQIYTVENWSITIPGVPAVEGYSARWESFTLKHGGVTINAIYTPIQYYITFVVNGFTIDTVGFTVESVTINEPEVPQMAGYSGAWEKYSMVCKNFTVNAVYTPINYTITYLNTKGASNSNPKSYNVENVFALEAISLFGYVFDGWYMDGKKINSVADLYQDLTLTAQWTLIEYKIIFTDENYNEIIATVTYTVEDTQIDIPEVPYKAGYVGEWSYFELEYRTSYVHAVYTKIE